jgi:hypothetical protein
MIPAGYMAKRISSRPEWLKAESVIDVYSVSGCISANFADYINFWKHNGYWFFDSPGIIRELAKEQSIDLTDTSLFYYEGHEFEFSKAQWESFTPEPSFTTEVVVPDRKVLEGFDVVNLLYGEQRGMFPAVMQLASYQRRNESALSAAIARIRAAFARKRHVQ